jgi:hypothetical protein
MLSMVEFLGAMRGLLHSRAFCPSSPLPHEGRRGRLGVLMPEMEDGTQGLPKKPAPVRVPHAPITGTCPDHVLCYRGWPADQAN